jgi:hypothetical protein
VDKMAKPINFAVDTLRQQSVPLGVFDWDEDTIIDMRIRGCAFMKSTGRVFLPVDEDPFHNNHKYKWFWITSRYYPVFAKDATYLGYKAGGRLYDPKGKCTDNSY